MSLLARQDRLTALSLSVLCFIFGCLLCLSAVISHNDNKGAGLDLQDLERISILLCSKCFMWQIWKGIQERADRFCVALFLSCKELRREKSNQQSDNMRPGTELRREVDPSHSGSSWVTVIKYNLMYKQKAFLLNKGISCTVVSIQAAV